MWAMFSFLFSRAGQALAALGGLAVLILSLGYYRRKAERLEANLQGVEAERRVESAHAEIDLATQKKEAEINEAVQAGDVGRISDAFNNPGRGGVREAGGRASSRAGNSGGAGPQD